MGIFETILTKQSKFRDSQNDLIQFMAGATFGGIFLYWAVWTWNLIVLA